MSQIKGKDTKPELLVRKILHAHGFRYRLHDKKLPGKPDLVLPKYKAVIQVNGCFWHGHKCHMFKWPKSRKEFWRNKINSNIQRDIASISLLEAMDWRVATIWECSVKGKSKLEYEYLTETLTRWLLSMKNKSLVLSGNV